MVISYPFYHSFILSFLKVLIVFTGTPCATPSKSMLNKEAIAEVIAVNDLLGVFGILFFQYFAISRGRESRSGFDYGLAVAHSNVGIVQRIDIYSHASSMLANGLSAAHHAVVKAGGIVGGHALLIIPIVLVDEPHPGNNIMLLEEFLENLQQVFRNSLVANQFARLHFTQFIVMKHLKIAQIISLCRAPLGK